MTPINELSDATIATDRAMTELGIQYGIFGGYAIVVLGGPRDTKDIDCFVHCTKESLLEKLPQVEGFKMVEVTRPDMVTFSYRESNFSIRFYPTSMRTFRAGNANVVGAQLGRHKTVLLGPEFLFKGKLAAAAFRRQEADLVDLLFLEKEYADHLVRHHHEFNKCYVGMAMRKEPRLRSLFERLGFDVRHCDELLRHYVAPSSPDGDCPLFAAQNSMLAHWRAEGMERQIFEAP